MNMPPLIALALAFLSGLVVARIALRTRKHNERQAMLLSALPEDIAGIEHLCAVLQEATRGHFYDDGYRARLILDAARRCRQPGQSAAAAIATAACDLEISVATAVMRLERNSSHDGGKVVR